MNHSNNIFLYDDNLPSPIPSAHITCPSPKFLDRNMGTGTGHIYQCQRTTAGSKWKEPWSLTFPRPVLYRWGVLALKGKGLSRVTQSQRRGRAKGRDPESSELSHHTVSHTPQLGLWAPLTSWYLPLYDKNKKTQTSALNKLPSRVPWKSNQGEIGKTIRACVWWECLDTDRGWHGSS